MSDCDSHLTKYRVTVLLSLCDLLKQSLRFRTPTEHMLMAATAASQVSLISHRAITAAITLFFSPSICVPAVNQFFENTNTVKSVVCVTCTVTPTPFPPSSGAHWANLSDLIGGFSVPMRGKAHWKEVTEEWSRNPGGGLVTTTVGQEKKHRGENGWETVNLRDWIEIWTQAELN